MRLIKLIEYLIIFLWWFMVAQFNGLYIPIARLDSIKRTKINTRLR